MFLKVLLFFFVNLIYFSNSFSHDCIPFSAVKEILNGFPTKPIINLDNNLTLEEAYCAQEKINYLINKKNNDRVGYKVGFTGEALQKRFDIKSPAIGTIYSHMFLSNNATISKNFGYRTFIEPDLLVVIKSSKIMEATSDLEILKNISTIHPFIEIPALRFKKDIKINGKMLIAANMLATKMIMAEGIKIDANEEGLRKIANLNTIFLDKDNNIIQEASTSNLMGSPLNVLKWLIDHLKSKGISLKEGEKVSLGSVGKLFPLENNSYKYFFEGFNKDKNVVKININ